MESYFRIRASAKRLEAALKRGRQFLEKEPREKEPDTLEKLGVSPRVFEP